jgi:hypothetical protein
MRRPAALALALGLLAGPAGCGDDSKAATKAAPNEPAPAPAPEPDESADVPRIHRDAATPLAATEYWHATALGRIRHSEADDAQTWVLIADGEGPRVIDTDALAGLDYKSLGYRAAVDDLVLNLRNPETRPDALARLEALTKTDRGAWENWIRWHAEHGDFLVYNEDLTRVEVDETLRSQGVALAVDGIRVRLSTPDRVRSGQPWKITLDVANVTAGDEAGPRQLCQRFALGEDIQVTLRRDDPQNAGEVDLRPATGEAYDLTPDSFVVLESGQDLSTTIDIAPMLPGELAPGQYRLRATYLGRPLLAEMSPAAPAWAGEASSLSKRVRVVEW